jgi:nucleoside-diphosphate-sugar epimerase
MSEGWARWTGQKTEPLLTRFVVDQLASEHWFCLDKIRKDLGYQPVISMQSGLQGITQWLHSVKESESASALSSGS